MISNQSLFDLIYSVEFKWFFSKHLMLIRYIKRDQIGTLIFD